MPVTSDAALPRSGLWVISAADTADAALIHRFARPGGLDLIVPYDTCADVADRFAARPVEDTDSLRRVLGLSIPPLIALIAEARSPGDAPGSFAALLAAAAARTAGGQPQSASLSLLDTAFDSFTERAPA